MRLLLNGHPPCAGDLDSFAITPYGHFTNLRVEQGGVRGLGLHLQRLTTATQALFDSALDVAALRSAMHSVAPDEGQESVLRVQVGSRAFDRAHPERRVVPDVLVAAVPAPVRPRAPLRLRSVVHERAMPELKHLGTFDLFHHRRLARLAGFDDAVFVGHDGRVREATVWNLGFFDGDAVVWPEAPMLDGVTMQLLDRASRSAGIPVRRTPVALGDLAGFDGAFLTNAIDGLVPVRSIDAVTWPDDARRIARLQAMLAGVTLEPI